MSKDLKLQNASFVCGAPSLDFLPMHELPELALVGRSNVGKSSLLNRLCGNSKLARTSNTPGRTQELNLFQAQLPKAPRGKEMLGIVDLPGFGFAKLSHARRNQLSQLTVDYLQQREALRIVILLNDSKRLPEEDELAIQQLTASRDVALLVALTKCDRLKRLELAKQTELISRAYHLESNDLIITGDGLSLDPLVKRIGSILL